MKRCDPMSRAASTRTPGANDVRLEERSRALMDRSTWLSAAKWTTTSCPAMTAIDELVSRDVTLHKGVSVRGVQFVRGRLHSGISECIEVGDSGVRLVAKHVADEVRADEPCTAGHQVATSQGHALRSGSDSYAKTSASLRCGAEASFADRIGSPSVGQSIPISGSFQRMERSTPAS